MADELDAGADAAAAAADPAPAAAGAPADAGAASQQAADWRAELAGGDEAFLGKLGRFKTSADFGKAYRALELKMSEAAKTSIPKLGEKPSEEQVAAYRSALGIPEKPDAYLELGNGLVIGDADKPLALSLAGKLHEANLPPAAMKAAYEWYMEGQEAMAEQDKAFAQQGEDALRVEWGPQYREHSNSLKAFLDTIPVAEGETSFAEALMGARGPDGRLLRDNPAIKKALLHIADQVNPAGFTMPGSGATATVESLMDRKTAIEKTMGTPAYDKNPKVKAEYVKILEKLERSGVDIAAA
jgi:hypothetical protein